MSDFNFVPEEKTSGGSGENIDFDYIADQIEEGGADARISVILDLGIHDQGIGIDTSGTMLMETEEEALDLIDRIEEMYSASYIEKEGLDALEDVDMGYKLPFKLVKDKWLFFNSDKDVTFTTSEREAKALLKKALAHKGGKKLTAAGKAEIIEMADCIELPFATFDGGKHREVTAFADLVDTYVEYVEGSDEELQYRVALTPPFNREVQGYTMNISDTKTFAPNSKMAKLLTATGNKDVMDLKSSSRNNIGKLLNSPLVIDIEKNKSFVKAKGTARPNAKAVVGDLDIDPVGITFTNATPELLEAAHVGYFYVEKIKSALNYDNINWEDAKKPVVPSKMKVAIEAWEAGKGGDEDTPDLDDEVDEVVEEEVVAEKPKRRRAKKVVEEVAEEEQPDLLEEEEETPPPKKKPVRRRKAKVVVEEPEDDYDDDIPF